jgi:hypothetical protein
MKLGAMQGPQLWGRFVDGEGGSCAMGAVMIAMGRPVKVHTFISHELVAEWVKIFPSLGLNVDGPRGGREYYTVWQHISAMNNFLNQTREQIADWIVESGNDCEAVLPKGAQRVEQPVEVTAK